MNAAGAVCRVLQLGTQSSGTVLWVWGCRSLWSLPSPNPLTGWLHVEGHAPIGWLSPYPAADGCSGILGGTWPCFGPVTDAVETARKRGHVAGCLCWLLGDVLWRPLGKCPSSLGRLKGRGTGPGLVEQLPLQEGGPGSCRQVPQDVLSQGSTVLGAAAWG